MTLKSTHTNVVRLMLISETSQINFNGYYTGLLHYTHVLLHNTCLLVSTVLILNAEIIIDLMDHCGRSMTVKAD